VLPFIASNLEYNREIPAPANKKSAAIFYKQAKQPLDAFKKIRNGLTLQNSGRKSNGACSRWPKIFTPAGAGRALAGVGKSGFKTRTVVRVFNR
jgi:hypothetical protein